jgi:hypothetical protein
MQIHTPSLSPTKLADIRGQIIAEQSITPLVVIEHADRINAELSDTTTGRAHRPEPGYSGPAVTIDPAAVRGPRYSETRPIGDTAELMRHLAEYGYPPVPTPLRMPDPFECAAYKVYSRRLADGDTGDRLARVLDSAEAEAVTLGGIYYEMLISRKWAEARGDHDAAGDLHGLMERGDKYQQR